MKTLNNLSLKSTSGVLLCLFLFLGCSSMTNMISQRVNSNQNATGEIIPAPPDHNIKLPDNYTFSYRATMRIETGKGVAEPVFYLQPDAPYFAQIKSSSELKEYLVYDNQHNVVVYFAEKDSLKGRIHNKFNLETKATLLGAYKEAPELEPVQSLGTKTILGYNSKGYKITTQAGTTELWITDEAPASLFSTMFAYHANHSQTQIPVNKKSMLMEIRFSSEQKPENNYYMECTQLEPEPLVLNKNDYEEPR